MDEQDNAQKRSPAEEQARIVEQMKKLKREFDAATEAKLKADLEDMRRDEPEEAAAVEVLRAMSVASQFGRKTLAHLKMFGGQFKPTQALQAIRVASRVAAPLLPNEREARVGLRRKVEAGELDIQDALKQIEEMVLADMQKAVEGICEALELYPLPRSFVNIDRLRQPNTNMDGVLPESWNEKQRDIFSLALVFAASFMADQHIPEMPAERSLL